jgi:hypothetical protein
MNAKVFTWQPIESAPKGENLRLRVMDAAGAEYSLSFPCMLTDRGFVTPKGTVLQVAPTHWMSFMHHTRRLNPKFSNERPSLSYEYPRHKPAAQPVD